MKKNLGNVNLLYPTPTILAGAIVDGKPNFNAIAHIGILNHAKPQYISLSMMKIHYTGRGIKEHRVFSVNIPSVDLVAEVDCCGIVSGKNVDKSVLFEVFYGELEAAPMIAQCPANMACRLRDVYDTPTHDVFVGEIVESYADESVITNEALDISKVRPVLFDNNSKKYWSLGSPIANAFNIGKELREKLRQSTPHP